MTANQVRRYRLAKASARSTKLLSSASLMPTGSQAGFVSWWNRLAYSSTSPSSAMSGAFRICCGVPSRCWQRPRKGQQRPRRKMLRIGHPDEGFEYRPDRPRGPGRATRRRRQAPACFWSRRSGKLVAWWQCGHQAMGEQEAWCWGQTRGDEWRFDSRFREPGVGTLQVWGLSDSGILHEHWRG